MNSPAPTARRVLLRCAMLAALCAITYFTGLTTHGLTNWQEAVRASVAREMHERDEWLVPTRGGEPYLAKPPMIYWAQRLVGMARGPRAFTSEFELRFVVAGFGLLGVLGTYLVGRTLLRRSGDPAHLAAADTAAFWGAVTLATGLLATRSARIGELDIVMVPFVVTAIGAIIGAWRGWLDDGRQRWGLLVVATLAASGATLTKGPPSLLVIALGAYGSIMTSGAAHALPKNPRGWAWVVGAAAAAGLAAAAGGVLHYEESRDWIGVLMFLPVGAALGAWLALVLRPGAVRRWAGQVARAHPWLVLGVPVLAFVGWGKLVAARIGAETVAQLAHAEVEDNLRILIPGSPINSSGFVLYALAPMSMIAAAAAVVLWSRRRRLASSFQPRAVSLLAPLTWAVLGVIAFTTLSKGVARYYMPVWPAIALLCGAAVAWWLRSMGDGLRRRITLGLAAAALLAAAGQGWWYGAGRERFDSSNSPRAIAARLLATPRFDPARMGTLDFEEPGFDWYLSRRTPEWRSRSARSLGELRAVVGAMPSPYTLLVREQTPEVVGRHGDARETLRRAGLEVVGELEVAGLYARSPGRTQVRAWLLRPLPGEPH